MRYFGHSNYSAEQARHAAQVAAEAGLDGFISSQIEYSLLHRTPEAELLPTAQDLGLGVFPYFPLANGLLTGKYTRDGGGEGRVRSLKPHLLETTNWDLLDAYQRICDEAGHSMLTVSIAWLLWHEPIASVIAGATRPDQVTQNAKAGSTAVSADVLRAVDELFA
ncbi:aldo/keto reductase [Tessaracoccus defluvii]|uniref:aldo/keto reductase n=1 Tax=Tessaracoccus defluvii TaxID=1285901 RepID=UPI0031E25390